MGLGNIGKYVDENWHGGQIAGDFYSNGNDMALEDNSVVDKKPNSIVWNWRHAVIRDLMRGRHKHEILSKYADVIKRFGLGGKIAEFLDKNDGFLGWFIVDVSNFDDKFCYDDMPEEMKKCNLYAYNATELREIISRSLISENDGTMDGFLNSGEEDVDEDIQYVDDCTGLPCVDDIDGIFDNDDERLSGIADYFLGRKWMTLAERDAFVKSENRLAYLVSVLRRTFAPKSNSSGKYRDDVDDYDVRQPELDAPSQKAIKYLDVNNIHERRMDDVGHTAMPEKFDIADEHRRSDYRKDVDVGKKVTEQDVNNIHERRLGDIGRTDIKKSINIINNSERKMDDIGDTSLKKEYNIKDEYVPSNKTDVDLQKRNRSVEIDDVKRSTRKDIDIQKRVHNDDADVTKESSMEEIITDVPDYGLFDDDMTELTDKDYRDDVKFDDVEEFTIDDIKDMKDDEFDYADLSRGDVDIDEMFDEESDKNEAEIDDVPEEIEISSKYDWSW